MDRTENVQFGHISATQHLHILVLFSNDKYIWQGAEKLCEISN